MSNILLESIQDEVRNKDQDKLIVICGDRGSGKSSAAIELGHKLDPNFSIRNVVFTKEEFMRAINNNDTPKGSVIIWDEIGIEQYSRDFFKEQNKLINHVFQSFRYKNFIVIVTTPSMKFIDNHTRILMNIFIEPLRINYNKKVTVAKWQNIQYNTKIDKLYYKYPRMLVNDEIVKITRVHFAKPPAGMWQQYVRKAKKYKDKLRSKVEAQLDYMERMDKKRTSSKSNEEIIKAVVDNLKEYKNRLGRINAPLIMSRHNVGKPRARSIKAEVEARLDL